MKVEVTPKFFLKNTSHWTYSSVSEQFGGIVTEKLLLCHTSIAMQFLTEPYDVLSGGI